MYFDLYPRHVRFFVKKKFSLAFSKVTWKGNVESCSVLRIFVILFHTPFKGTFHISFSMCEKIFFRKSLTLFHETTLLFNKFSIGVENLVENFLFSLRWPLFSSRWSRKRREDHWTLLWQWDCRRRWSLRSLC